MSSKFKDLRLRNKLLIVFLPVGLIPMILASVLSYMTASDWLGEAVRSQIEAQRTSKIHQLRNYFDSVDRLLKSQSNNLMVVEAMQQFKHAFMQYKDHGGINLNDADVQKQKLAEYYDQFYFKLLKERFNKPVDHEDYLPSDPATIAFQLMYVATSNFREGVLERGAAYEYLQTHEKYHEVLKDFARTNQLHDVYLIDHETGYIVYSSAKSVDFAHKMEDGPFRDSRLSEVFLKVRQGSPGVTAMVDFSAYAPSLMSQVGFIATPIFNETRDQIGILAYQIPFETINFIMTNQQRWEALGMGRTGETYILGADSTLRSEPRLFLEDPEAYYEQLKAQGVDEELIRQIKTRGSTIGLHAIDNRVVSDAVDGFSGYTTYRFLGEEFVGAFGFVEIEGLQWSVFSQMAVKEAFAPVNALRRQVIVVAFLMVLLIVGTTIFFARYITKPLMSIGKVIEFIQQGNFTKRARIQTQDELGKLGQSFNDLLTQLSGIMQKIGSSTDMITRENDGLARSISVIAKTVHDLSQLASTQSAAVEETSATMNEIEATVESNSRHVKDANNLSKETEEHSQELHKTVQKMDASMQRIAETSQEVNNFISAIREIADQTNLLSLNAAIEAVKAGNHGKGFAVVADEVRRLAENSAKVTQDIQLLIKQNRLSVQEGQNAVTLVDDGLKQIHKLVTGNVELMYHISIATNEQTSAMHEINQTLQSLAKSSFEVAEYSRTIDAEVESQTSAAAKASKHAKSLQKNIHGFKY